LYEQEKYYPGDRVVVLKRSKQDAIRLQNMPDPTAGDIELMENKKGSGGQPQPGKLRKLESVHKKKIGEHGTFNMHAHGAWSVEEMKEASIGVARGKTGVITKCGDHVNRYVIEFDEKVIYCVCLFVDVFVQIYVYLFETSYVVHAHTHICTFFVSIYLDSWNINQHLIYIYVCALHIICAGPRCKCSIA
jgi:hypothetical protein